MKDIAINYMKDSAAEGYIHAVAKGKAETKWKVILTGEYVPVILSQEARQHGIQIEKIGYPIDYLTNADKILTYFSSVFHRVAQAETEGKNVLFCCTAGRHFSPSMAQLCDYARGKEKIASAEQMMPLTETYLEMITSAIYVKFGRRIAPTDLYKEISSMWNAQKKAVNRETKISQMRHGRILTIKHPNLKLPFHEIKIPKNTPITAREKHSGRLSDFLNRFRKR